MLRPLGHVSSALGAAALGFIAMGMLHPGSGVANSGLVLQPQDIPLSTASLRLDVSEASVVPIIRQASSNTLGSDWPAIFGTPPPPEVEQPEPEPQAAPEEEPDLGPFLSEDFRLTGSVLGAGTDLAFIRGLGEELIVRQGSALPSGGKVIAIAAGEVQVQHDDGSISLIVPPGDGQDRAQDMLLAEAAAEARSSDPDVSAWGDGQSDDEWLNDWDDDWYDESDLPLQDILDEGWDDEDWDYGWDEQWNDASDYMVDDDHEPTREEMGQ